MGFIQALAMLDIEQSGEYDSHSAHSRVMRLRQRVEESLEERYFFGAGRRRHVLVAPDINQLRFKVSFFPHSQSH